MSLRGLHNAPPPQLPPPPCAHTHSLPSRPAFLPVRYTSPVLLCNASASLCLHPPTLVVRAQGSNRKMHSFWSQTFSNRRGWWDSKNGGEGLEGAARWERGVFSRQGESGIGGAGGCLGGNGRHFRRMLIETTEFRLMRTIGE